MKNAVTPEQLLTDLLTAILGDRTADIIHDYGLASAVDDAITTVQVWSQELWPSLDERDVDAD